MWKFSFKGHKSMFLGGSKLTKRVASERLVSFYFFSYMIYVAFAPTCQSCHSTPGIPLLKQARLWSVLSFLEPKSGLKMTISLLLLLMLSSTISTRSVGFEQRLVQLKTSVASTVWLYLYQGWGVNCCGQIQHLLGKGRGHLKIVSPLQIHIQT